MKSWKPLILCITATFILTVVVPVLVVMPFQGQEQENLIKSKAQATSSDPLNGVEVAVFRSDQEKIDQIPLEEYVVGVVASEMPADFELEALKAQALAARTYITKLLLQDDPAGVPQGAQVTDTISHQVYKDDEELRSLWKEDYEENKKKIEQAVDETRGKILTYANEPIDAFYFSTSNGYTENSQDYWANEVPYLKSVKSTWDQTSSPKYEDQKSIPIEIVETALNITLPEQGEIGTILERTAGERVATVQLGEQTFTGRQVREALELRSSDFTWTRNGNEILFQTEGYGHGVGMSQYGANGMAREGKTAEQIVTYYYQGIEIGKAANFLKKTVVYSTP